MSEPAGRDAVWTGELPRVSNGAAAAGLNSPGGAGERRRVAQRASARKPATKTERIAGTASLRLVADSGRLVGDVPAHALPERARSAQSRPVRLTRRGRMVITAAIVLAIGVLFMALAGAAGATGHSGAPATPGRGVTKVVIRAGESLWSVAEAYDPNADTRAVIAEIVQMNSLNSDQVQPGQVLWVPRG